MRGGWFGGCLNMALAAGFGASVALAAGWSPDCAVFVVSVLVWSLAGLVSAED